MTIAEMIEQLRKMSDELCSTGNLLDYHQESRLMRVIDLVDEAIERLEDFTYLDGKEEE